MQSIPLTYYQRLILWNICGSHAAPSLREAAIFLRLIDKLRLSDTESRESQFSTDNNRFAWKLPKAGYGDKVFELEDSDCVALASAIDASTPVRVVDADWLEKLVTRLLNTPKPDPKPDPPAQPLNAGPIPPTNPAPHKRAQAK